MGRFGKVLATLLAAAIAWPGSSQTRLIPHVTASGGGFSTQVIASNCDDDFQDFSLTPFTAEGVAGGTISVRLSGGETGYFAPDELFEFNPAHFRIEGSTAIEVSVAYRAILSAASPAHVHETRAQAKVWRLLPGDWSLAWDGLAVVNLGTQVTSMEIRQIGSDGATISTYSDPRALEPNGKLLVVLGDHFQSMNRSHFVIESNQPLALTALRGTLAADYLWENAALPQQAAADTITSANYTVTFNASWSAQTHPLDFPSSAHFSGLIGATHHAGLVFWDEGVLASQGIKTMAELGGKSPMIDEINQAIQAGLAEALISGGGISVSPGSVSVSFDISASFPLVTLVSMVAPSPDWFVGVNGLRLYENGQWLEQKTVNLYPFDAGTDSGATYAAANLVTLPAEPIFRLPTPPFLIDGKVPPLGTFTFVKN